MINCDINSDISLAWNEIQCTARTPFGANIQPRFNRIALSRLTDLVSIYHGSNKATSHNVIAFKLMNVNTG